MVESTPLWGKVHIHTGRVSDDGRLTLKTLRFISQIHCPLDKYPRLSRGYPSAKARVPLALAEGAPTPQMTLA